MNDGPKNALPPQDAETLRKYIESKGLPAQVDAITSDKPLTVVSAGAGTGKTWTLAWRYIWAALTRTDARNILTLTFTEKAAAEMRSRIGALLKSLDSEMEKDGFVPSETLLKRRAASLEQLDGAYISTIHGFGMRVMGEAGIALPIEPSPRLVSDAEADEFWNGVQSALDRTDAAWFCAGMDGEYAQKVKKLFEDERTIDVINAYKPEAIAGFARKFEGAMTDFDHTLEELPALAEKPAPAALKPFMGMFEKLAVPWYKKCVLSTDTTLYQNGSKTAQAVKNFESLSARWVGRDISKSMDSVEFITDAYATLSGASGKFAGEIADELGFESISKWRKHVESTFTDKENLLDVVDLLKNGWNENELLVRKKLIGLAAIAWEKWNAYKTSRGGITFSDMVGYASQAVRKNPDYAKRFEEILVDEFQDTNRQQNELITSIISASGARLFIVGDLKQSIYRFRHAEPKLFAEYINLKDGHANITLNTSFRSCKSVLDAVNERFSRLWKSGMGEGLEVPYEALSSPENPLPERGNVTLPIAEAMFEKDQDGVEESISQIRERLARRLAKRLIELREQKKLTWDKGALRPVEWRDMAILVPTRTSYQAIESAFTDAGIPVTFNSSKKFYSRTEIRDITALTAILSDERDKIALAGWLCSPFSGLTTAQAQKMLPSLTSVNPMEDLEKLSPRCAQKIAKLRKIAEFQGCSKAIAQLLQDLTFLKGITAHKRSGVIANLRRAIGLLEEYESSFGTSPSGAAAYLADALKADADKEEANADEGENAVQVNTIHSTKGLEYPLVILFGLEKESSPKLRDAAAPSQHLIAVANKAPENWPEMPFRLGTIHKLLEKQASYEELERLYYVALTRARDGIMLCGAYKKNLPKKSYIEIEQRCGKDVSAKSTPPEELVLPEHDGVNQGGGDYGHSRELPMNTGRVHTLANISATSYATWSSCRAAWRMKYRQGVEPAWSAQNADISEDRGGTEFGSVAHWLMSRWDFTQSEAERLMSFSDGQLRPEYRCVWRDEPSKRALQSMFDTFATNGATLLDRLTKAQQNGMLKREQRFSARVTHPQNGASVELIGIVDVFWTENGEDGKPARLCVRDYKTTRIPADAKRKRWIERMYAHQLAFYAYALRKAHPEYADLELDLALYNLRTGEERKIRPLTSDDERRIEKELLEQALVSAQPFAESFPPNASACAQCPFSKSCTAKRGD